MFTHRVWLWVSSLSKHHCSTSVTPQPCQLFVCDITFKKILVNAQNICTYHVKRSTTCCSGVTEQQNPALTWFVFILGGRYGTTLNVTWCQCHQALSRQLLTSAACVRKHALGPSYIRPWVSTFSTSPTQHRTVMCHHAESLFLVQS